jgi:hypothetical protein
MIVSQLNYFLRYLLSQFSFEILHVLVKHVVDVDVQVSAYGQGALCELFWIFGKSLSKGKAYLNTPGARHVRTSCPPPGG